MNSSPFQTLQRRGLPVIGFVLLPVLTLAVRLPALGKHVFVFDEAIYYMASQSVAEHGYVWANMRAIGHAHPPAFFMLQAAWIRFVEASDLNLSTEVMHRSPSVLLAGLTTMLVFGLATKFDGLTGLLASATIALHPFFVAYTRLGVLESLLLFLCASTLSLYVWALKTEGRMHRGLLSLSGLALSVAILTKTYALLLLPALIVHRGILLAGYAQQHQAREILRQFAGDLSAFISATLGGVLLFSAVWAGDPFVLIRIWQTSFGWTSGVVHGRLWVIDSLIEHLGIVTILIAVLGTSILSFKALMGVMDVSQSVVQASSPMRSSPNQHLQRIVFPLLIVTWGIAFSLYTSTQFARYLLPVAMLMTVMFGYGVSWIAASLRRITAESLWPALFVAALTCWMIVANTISLSRVYSALIIDDWWHINGFRKVAQAIADRDSRPEDFFVTNGHYPVLSAYTGLPGGLSLSFAGERPQTYWIWYGAEATTTIELTPELESRLRYIVLVESYRHIPPEYVLFNRELDHTWSEVDSALLQYVLNRYQPMLITDEPFGNVALFGQGDARSFGRGAIDPGPESLRRYLRR